MNIYKIGGVKLDQIILKSLILNHMRVVVCVRFRKKVFFTNWS